jgi:hypothetical protein
MVCQPLATKYDENFRRNGTILGKEVSWQTKPGYVQPDGNGHHLLTSELTAVGNFVTVKASKNRKVQQIPTSGLQRFQYQSLAINKSPASFTMSWNLVRDQGVGGSNPLSPTNLFKRLQLR